MSGNVTKYDIQELLKREYDEISMGLTPSGYIHLGTLYTMAQPLLYLSEHNDTKIEICITDLDFDNKFTLDTPYNLAKTDGISNIERTKSFMSSNAFSHVPHAVKVEPDKERENLIEHTTHHTHQEATTYDDTYK